MNYKEVLNYLLYIRDLIPKYIKEFNILSSFNIWDTQTFEIIIQANSLNLFNICFFLHNHSNCVFESLIEIAAVDYPKKKKNYELNYIFLSHEFGARLRVKIKFMDSVSINSLVSIFPSANWLEREVWDMFGIFFKNHPDLRRILTDYGFNSFPLRKDFPVHGYVQLRYDDHLKQLIYEPINFSQEFRVYEFKNPWEQTK